MKEVRIMSPDGEVIFKVDADKAECRWVGDYFVVDYNGYQYSFSGMCCHVIVPND